MVKLGYSREEIMSKLQSDIEELFIKHNSWLDSLVDYCERYDLEESEVTPYLSPVMIERIKDESLKLNMLKRSNFLEASLPF